jgi:hypothetical protein
MTAHDVGYQPSPYSRAALLFREEIKHGAKRPAWMAVAVATQRLAYRLDVGAALKRDAADDSARKV